jgi:hypothetical protein
MADKKEITVMYDRGKDVKSVPVNGAYGGVSPNLSTVVAHLYNEYNAIPHSEDMPINEDGLVDSQAGKRITRGDIVREIQTTLVMTPEMSIVIGKWLMQKGQEAIELRKNNK